LVGDRLAEFGISRYPEHFLKIKVCGGTDDEGDIREGGNRKRRKSGIILILLTLILAVAGKYTQIVCGAGMSVVRFYYPPYPSPSLDPS